MQRAILWCLVLALASVLPGWAQESQAPAATKIGQFVARDSHLFSLDVYPLGNLVGYFGSYAALSAVVVTDVQAKSITKGLRVEVHQTKPAEQTEIVWCDVEELLDLSWSLGYVFGETQKPRGQGTYAGAGAV
jgi:hypothetical protein